MSKSKPDSGDDQPSDQPMDVQVATLISEVRQWRREQRTMNEILTGNGEPAKGLVLRVDRIEQTHGRQKAYTAMALSGVVTLAFDWVNRKLKGQP